MDTNLKYMPTLRVRQQEIIVLRSFDFENHIYPLLEIVKEYDRSRKEESQKSFEDIHIDLIQNINARKVFVDLPVYLKESGSMKNEVMEFSLRVISNLDIRSEYLNKLRVLNQKIIPVISSYLLKTGEQGTIQPQFESLVVNYNSIAFRLFPQTFNIDFPIVQTLARETDYIILDLDQIPSYHLSPPIKPIVNALKSFNVCTKILLRSAINTEIQNVRLEHGEVIFEADNSILDTYQLFWTSAFGDYAGIKKDDLTAGGTISPGFIYYDATDNQYYGYKASIKHALSEFENTIVPDVLNSTPTQNMLTSDPVYLTNENSGYKTLLNISMGGESGKSQAKFKKIALEHYLFCIREMIRSGKID